MAITTGTIVIGPEIGVDPGGIRDSVRYLASARVAEPMLFKHTGD